MKDMIFDIEEMLSENETRTHLDFFANVPCPMKPAFKEAYEQMAKEHYNETGEQFFSYIMTHCPTDSEKLDKMIDVCSAQTADELPEVFFSYALDEAANKDFINRFIKADIFEKVISPEKCQIINSSEFIDKYNSFNIISLFTEAIMIDKMRIGNLPIPKTFDDLLDPVYKNSISLPDSHGCIDGTLPVYIYKKYGKEGLEALEKNVCTATCTIDAIKNAGNLSQPGAPIHIVSWMFANAHIRTDKAELIWPEDGVLSEPILLFVKKDYNKKLDKIIDFLIGDKVAALFANNYLPATNPDVINKIPENAKFQWLGWDYIFDNDMNEIYNMVSERFQKYIQPRN